MILGRYKKQPREVKDYPVDYGDWLAEIEPPDVVQDVDLVSIVNESNPSDATLVLDRIDINSQGCAVWLSGGTAGETYKVDCLTTTAGGRKDEFEFIISVVEY